MKTKFTAGGQTQVTVVWEAVRVRLQLMGKCIKRRIFLTIAGINVWSVNSLGKLLPGLHFLNLRDAPLSGSLRALQSLQFFLSETSFIQVLADVPCLNLRDAHRFRGTLQNKLHTGRESS